MVDAAETGQQKFAILQAVNRIWAVAAIRGQARQLAHLHDQLTEKFQPGDGIIYLGDMIGFGTEICATIDELLRFRRAVMAQPPLRFPSDVVFLRGRQEEMWRKLLQLQFAPNPADVVTWMEDRGIASTLEAYGGSLKELHAITRDGPVAIARWTQSIKDAIAAQPGHNTFYNAIWRAAYSDDGTLLFVNSGLNPDRPVTAQNDSFWWDAAGFNRLQDRYGSFDRIIRGSDPEAGGWQETPLKLSIDGGAGHGGDLHAICLTTAGETVHVITA